MFGTFNRRLVMLCTLLGLTGQGMAAGAPAAAAGPVAADSGLLQGGQILQFLDRTVAWYRSRTAQEQIATEPADLVALADSRATAVQVVQSGFDFARSAAALAAPEQAHPAPDGTPARYAQLPAPARSAAAAGRHRQHAAAAAARAARARTRRRAPHAGIAYRGAAGTGGVAAGSPRRRPAVPGLHGYDRQRGQRPRAERSDRDAGKLCRRGECRQCARRWLRRGRVVRVAGRGE